MKRRALNPRQCQGCGKTYYRGNRLRVWTAHNPGSRTGWLKEDVKTCTDCTTAESAKRTLMIATATIGKRRKEVA